MKYKKTLTRLSLFLLLLLIFCYLLLKFLSLDFIEHDRFNGSLRRLNQIDATLNKDIFELRYGVLGHYDTVVKAVQEIELLQNKLQKVPKYIGKSGQIIIKKELDNYQKNQQKKEELIEKFKSTNAVLKNSLFYFPVLVTELTKKASNNEDSGLVMAFNDLLKEVLVFNLTSSQETAPIIIEKLEYFKENLQKYTGEIEREELELMIAHAYSILNNKSTVDNLVTNLVSLPTNKKGEELYKLYNQEYAKALQKSAFYRLLLYLYTLGLIISISAYFILKLRRAAKTVRISLEATQQAEEKYRSIFENSTDGIFQITLNGQYINVNPTLAHIYGYDSPQELINSITDIASQIYVDSEHRAEFLELMNEQDTITQFEAEVYHKTGKIIWTSENGRSVKDAEGNLLYYEGTVEDITKRKEIETLLKESKNRLIIQQEALLELATCQPIYSGDLLQAYQEITENAARTLKVDRASIWHYNQKRTILICLDLYQQTLHQHSAGIELFTKDYPSYFQALETERVIAAVDALVDPRTKEFKDSYLIPLGIQAMLDIPIRVGERIIGVLCLEHLNESRKWALEERNFISYLGYMASLAIEAHERKQAQIALRQEQEKVEELLLNILPAPIAERLKKSSNSIADHFEEVTVLFGDIVGFTQLSASISPTELVNNLNEIFSCFDQLAEYHQLEKIKTIGDAYMVVGGLPTPRLDHAEAIANMALDMQIELAKLSQKMGMEIKIRIGINTGPVVAGVIGLKKFIYDLWGDTVNTASRMESHGIPGTIQVTAATYQRLSDKYKFENRGVINIKGKGDMDTYILTGRKT